MQGHSRRSSVFVWAQSPEAARKPRGVGIKVGGHYPGRWPAIVFGRR